MNKELNPTIKELQDSKNFELIAELHHNDIKEFVLSQISKGGKLVKGYMIYQLIMIILGGFILTISVVSAFRQNPNPLYWCLIALIFCFTLLVVLHELLHGIAIKLTGATKINYGAYVRKFIFYAEADQHVMNQKQFTMVALTPLVIIKFLTLIGVLFTIHHPAVFGVVFVMCAHSLFCAGDIGLLSIFFSEKDTKFYTFDVRSERKSYYYKKL